MNHVIGHDMILFKFATSNQFNSQVTEKMKKQILVVDDEETLCEALKFNLEAEGYDVDVATSAEEALSKGISSYDLILLDIMMGEISGLQLAKIIKTSPATADTPIIFCTARDSEDDMIEGLDLGADDYIMKPYSLRNVMARVRTVLRRSDTIRRHAAAAEQSESIDYMGLSVIPSMKRCVVDGVDVSMPRKEFEILLKLLSNRGQIFSRDELLKSIWPDEVVVVDRVVDVNINRIRQKIGRYGKNIVTRTGYGYGFME